MEIRDQLARQCRYFLEIRRRGIIKKPEEIAATALRFVESDLMIDAIQSVLPRDDADVIGEWTIIKAEFYEARAAGEFDSIDAVKRRTRQALIPITRDKVAGIKRKLIAAYQETTTEPERERIMLEIGELNLEWAGIKRELKK